MTKRSNESQEHGPEEDFPELVRNIPVGEHIEEVEEAGRKVRRKGVFLLPNLFTLGALFAGFYAIIAAMNSHFDNAALAIVAAALLDAGSLFAELVRRPNSI